MKVHGYSPKTIKSYRCSLGVFLGYLERIGISDPRQVSSAAVRDYQLWLQQQDYAGWTILTRLQAVHRFFQHLETTQVMLLSPCLHHEPLRLAYRLPKTVLTRKEARRMLNIPDLSTLVGLRDKAILEIFYSSGIRLEEMTRLNLAEVDAKNGFLRVNRGKGGSDRVVPLGQTASQCVRQYLEQARSRWCPVERNEPALWLSSLLPHEPLKSQAIAVMIKQCGRRAGLSRHVTPHVWRHTCATHLVAGGANIAYVQRLLGHASLRTTQIYVRTSIPEIKATLAQAHPRNQEAGL